MMGLPGPLGYLVLSMGVSIIILLILFVWGNILSMSEDDQFHVNKVQEEMASDQGEVLAKMKTVRRAMIAFGVLSGILFLASATTWVWIGFTTS